MRSLPIVALSVVAFAAGCYQYIPSARETLTPGTTVRVRVAPTYVASMRLDEVLPSEGDLIRGSVMPGAGDTLHLLVEVPAARRSAVGGPSLNQHLALPPASILQLEVRRVDRQRTGLLAAAGVAIVGAVLWSQFTGWFGGDTMPVEPSK